MDVDRPREVQRSAWVRWRQSTAADVLYAAVITATLLVGSYGEAHPSQPSDQVVGGHATPVTPTAAYLLVVLAAGVLCLRRRRPAVALVVSTAAVVAYTLLGYVNGSALLAPVLALYAVASRTRPVRAVAWSLAALVVLGGVSFIRNPFGPLGGGSLLIPGLVAAALFGGLAVSSRRALLVAIQERAEEQALQRVDAERLRIARELHDVVAHTMATINVQAGVAVHVMHEQPAEAEQAMRMVKSASKDGLRELRAILEVLRHAEEGDETQPAPGLARLDALVERATAAGLPTSVEVSGRPRRLPAAVDLAAYRIVQEALTNAIRHAGPATATVALAYLPGEVRVEVTDTGRGPAARSGLETGGGAGGFGLVGMRERAASVGGTVSTGPGAAGGFRVLARLPASDDAGPQTGGRPDEKPAAARPTAATQ